MKKFFMLETYLFMIILLLFKKLIKLLIIINMFICKFKVNNYTIFVYKYLLHMCMY
jgi:hypothetical protein